MNKRFYILGFAALSLLAGCSADEEALVAASENAGENLEAGVGLNSDVKIRLSSRSNATRSSVESTEGGLFEAEGVGIFCLATGYQNSSTSTEHPIDWMQQIESGLSNNDGKSTSFSAWLDNEKANAEYGYDAADMSKTTPIETNIIWYGSTEESPIEYYYPIGSWYNYSFYGYYPYDSGSMLEKTSTTRKVKFTIDGTQDVIWGKASSAEQYAYSAKYFRQTENAGKVPEMQFKHVLMRITFTSYPGAAADGTITKALTMGVKSITILDVPTQGEMVIADLNTPSNEGIATFDWTDADIKSDLAMTDPGDATFGNDHWLQSVDNDGATPLETAVGQGFIVPVPPSGTTYYIKVVLEDKSGREFISEFPIELSNSIDYEAGKSYNVRLTIYGPQDIKLNATLEPWTIDTSTIDGIEL
ncbi:MAG: fimbrillin family protein [Prevotella sp.]